MKTQVGGVRSSRRSRLDSALDGVLSELVSDESEIVPMTFSLPEDSFMYEEPIEVTAVEQKWKVWSDRILRSNAWGRLWRVLDKAPKEIVKIFDQIEANCNGEAKLEEGSRNKIYKDFFRIASTNFGELHSWEVDGLIHSETFTQALGVHDLDTITRNKLFIEVFKKRASADHAAYDFEKFVGLLYDIMLLKTSFINRRKQELSYQFRIYFPIDPDSPAKQSWDSLMMLVLLYCSFDIPYNLAFYQGKPDDIWTPYELWSIFLDCTLLVDIALTFVTAIEVKGVIVSRFRPIANEYLRTWFLPDLVGSFPFDLVIQAILSAALQGSSAMQIFRVIKLARVARLIRTAKFFSRLNQLSRTERFSGCANLIAVLKAVLLLAFTAHSFGAMFTLIIPDEGPNWMANYRSGELASAPSFSKYVLALYWATVSLTTMGYGDVVPVTTRERMLCILVALCGSLIFSFCIGSISSLMTEAKGFDHAYRTRVRTARDYLEFREVAPLFDRQLF